MSEDPLPPGEDVDALALQILARAQARAHRGGDARRSLARGAAGADGSTKIGRASCRERV